MSTRFLFRRISSTEPLILVVGMISVVMMLRLVHHHHVRVLRALEQIVEHYRDR